MPCEHNYTYLLKYKSPSIHLRGRLQSGLLSLEENISFLPYKLFVIQGDFYLMYFFFFFNKVRGGEFWSILGVNGFAARRDFSYTVR